jgi:hypothetical protein
VQDGEPAVAEVDDVALLQDPGRLGRADRVLAHLEARARECRQE